MKEIIITFDYESRAFNANADPAITSEDQIILFSNESEVPCQIVFAQEAAFGILGIIIGPESGFTLVYRGVETAFRLSTLPEVRVDHNPTIPPGGLIRRKKD